MEYNYGIRLWNTIMERVVEKVVERSVVERRSVEERRSVDGDGGKKIAE